MILLSGLLRYLELSAERFPQKTAFADETDSVSFVRLRELGRSVGASILSRAETGSPVAVLTTHSVADIVAFIGALYAGCFYIPLDANAPREHTGARLEAIRPAVTIEAKTLADLPCQTPDSAQIALACEHILPNDPAYAIFTSGSTGQPKAALISHGSVVNLTEWMCDTFHFSENTVFAAQTPFYFDSSVQEIYSTLKCGCTTHLFPRKLFISPLKVLRRVEELGANVLPWAAVAVKMIANSGVFEQYVPSGVTDVIFGGENMPAKLLNIWRRAMPEARFTNVYGPTETTVDCSYHTVNRDLREDGSVPIGVPVRGDALLLLDEDGGPVPDGQPGEIYVRGAGVGLGYYGDAKRTSAVFVQNPLNTKYRDIVYRTGDIAKVNEYGEFVFLSRADDQIKHMGSRVELGEVETAAAGLEGVDVVFCAYDKEKAKILLFYQGAMSRERLTAELSKRLPRYMCPNVIIQTDQMPATPNGKIDRLRARKNLYDDCH